MSARPASFRVFVSHSMRPEDLKTIDAAAEQMRLSGIHCYVAERDLQLGADLPEKLAKAIVESDCLVAFLTRGGSASAWVQQEIAFAIGRQRPVIPVVEKGLHPQGFLTGVEYLEFDREDPQPAIQRLTAYLSAQHAQQQQMRAESAERDLAVVQRRATIAEAVAIGALLALAIIAFLVLTSASAGGTDPPTEQGQ